MNLSKIQDRINTKKVEEREYLAEIIVDLCFVTSYKIEELLSMPPLRLNLLIERFKFHFEKKGAKK